MLAGGGDSIGAAELMEQALERAPGWAAGWFACGSYREKAGDLTGAISAFQRVGELDVEDLFGWRLKLATLGAAAMPLQPSSRYIERFFDDYADRFDTSLVEKLDYEIPRKLADLLAEGGDLPQWFRNAVDLGCGTGLFGQEIRDRTGCLEGFDLSARMLAKAAAKKLYDHLAVADLSLAADESGLFGSTLPPHRADLIAATDVMIYLGGLDRVFELARKLAMPQAVFAFSVEGVEAGEGFRLENSLRYSHSAAYVETICEAHGFAVHSRRPTMVRMDAGKPIPGLLFVARLSE